MSNGINELRTDIAYGVARATRAFALEKWGHIGLIFITPERQDKKLYNMTLRTDFTKEVNKTIEEFSQQRLNRDISGCKLVHV